MVLRFPLLCLLLVTAARADENPFVAKYRAFFQQEVEGRWASEELSDVRVLMVRGFQKHDVAEAATWLIDEPLRKDDAADVVRETVRVLSGYKSPETVDAMAQTYTKLPRRDWEARTLLLSAFGAMTGATALGPIGEGLKDKDARVCAAACRAAGAGRRLQFRGELERLLKHKHSAVRGAAVTALGELGGDESLPQVFQLFCADDSRRVRYDAWLALRRLTLDEQRPCDPAAWEEFWKARAAEVPEGGKSAWGTSFPKVNPKTGTPGDFFGIPVLGDRVCFVLDTTRDMGTPWKIDPAAERAKPPEERTPSFFNVKTRWSLVRVWTERCVAEAPDGTEVALVFYNEKPTLWPENGKFVKLNASVRGKIGELLDTGVRLESVTAMYEGLKAAWGLLKGGDPEVNFDRGCDTLVFVTDGRPTHGELANRPAGLMDEAWRIAVTRQLRFHTVGLFNHQFDLLQGMARDSGGLYVHAQPADDGAEPQDLEFWPAKKKAFEEERKRKKQGN